MKYTYTEHELRGVFCEALDLFNECLDTSITKENTILAFFVPSNGKEVYEKLCREYFPKSLSEPYWKDEFFDTFAAQAFVGEEKNGILIRADIDFSLADVHYTMLHEISHIYCTRNEIECGNFFERYCMGCGEEDGMINAGYAIWREAVADIMASSVLSETTGVSLFDIRNAIMELNAMVSADNPDSKLCMSLMIAYIMNTREVAGTEKWSMAEKAIKRACSFDDPMMYYIMELVFRNLHESPFWKITRDFISELGQAYLSLLAFRKVEFLS